MKSDNNNNHYERKPEYWESMTKKRRGIFRLKPLIQPILVTAVLLALYYYLVIMNQYFYGWQNYILWTVKIIIAYEILITAARTLWAPILTLLIAVPALILEKIIDLAYITPADAWELIFVAIIGFLITLIVKL